MIKSRGPNVSPGVELSHDRSGNSIAPLSPTLRHPFAVQSMGMREGNAQFSIHEGNVFTGNGAGQALVKIDTTTITKVSAGITNDNLDNTNQSTYYETPLVAGEDKLIYVRIKNDLDDKAFKYELVAKTVAQVSFEINNEAPFMYSAGATQAGTQNNFPVQLVKTVQHCGITYTVTLNQQGRRYVLSEQWIGTFQYPVALLRLAGGTVTCTQILRSDIFFPHSRTETSEYVDTGVTSVNFAVQGECPCAGCGCGGCCGCECCTGCCTGCCGTGCCGCGCGCAECPPDLPPPTNPVPPKGGPGSGSPSGSRGGGNYSGLERYVVEREIPGTRNVAQLDDFTGPFPIYGPVSPKPASAFPRPNGTPATPGTPGTEYAYFAITKYRYERIPGTAPDQSPASFEWKKISDIYTVQKLPYSYKNATFNGWPP